MPQINIGDTVRFLNTTGGGTVTRIKDNLAYVADEDGFEQPVLLRECVVVTTPGIVPSSTKAPTKATTGKTAAPQPTPRAEPLPPAVETPEGENLKLVIGFEASDLKRLSSASFDAYLVNDSNYYLHYTVSTRGHDDASWTLRAAATLDPGTQDFIFELTTADLPYIDRIALQAIAFKKSKEFTMKPPVNFERRLDATRFARLHCFQPNPYFDVPVISIDITTNPEAAREQPMPTADEISRAIAAKGSTSVPVSKPRKAHKSSEPLEVDLHATELLDTTAGMSAADILNYQIDYFRRIMDENLRFPGRKIVFIHGNGEGVLRQALMKELNYRYKGHEVADASFREYGFGATMVTIRNIKR